MGLPLITKAEYKAYMGISSTNEDTKIDILITKVSALVKSFCNSSLVDYVDDVCTEYFDGGTSFYVPLEGPVISVSSLAISQDYGNTYTDLTLYSDYAYSKQTQLIKAIGNDFISMPNAYRLIYNAGYEVLPEDLKLAIFDLVTYYMKNDSALHSNKAPGTNSVQIEYVTNTSLPAHIRRVLDLYANTYN